MKAFTKKLLVLITLFVFTLGLGVFAACSEKDDGTTYTVTVTVLNPDGTPNTDARVQLCEVIDEETGELGVCWDGVKVDKNGVSVQKTLNLNPVEVHIQDATGYRADPVRLDKEHPKATINLYPDDGLEAYTVTVSVAGGSVSDLSELPEVLLTDTVSGDEYTEVVNAQGVASFRLPAASYIYGLSEVPAGYSSTFGTLTSVSRTGTITLTPTESTVRIRLFFSENAAEEGFLETLRGKAVGEDGYSGWEVTVQLSRAGTPIGKRAEVKLQPKVDYNESYYYVELSATTGYYSVDFYLTRLDPNAEPLEYRGSTYDGKSDDGEIEISPAAAQTSSLILYPFFNVEAQQVPASQPQAPAGTAFTDYPLDGSAGQQFVFDDDNIMHIGSVDGPVVYAAAGRENRLFGEVSFVGSGNSDDAAPDWTLYDTNTASSTYGIRFNYLPEFVSRYHSVCENGLTAVTRELYELLQRRGGSYTATGDPVDADCRGLIACGYFSPVTPVNGVAGNANAGSAGNPYALRPLVGVFEITIPAGSAGVYYAIETTETMLISSASENAKITYGVGSADSTESGTFRIMTSGKVSSASWDGNGIVFLLGSSSGSAATYQITVATAPGSRANPYDFGLIADTGAMLTKEISLTDAELSSSAQGAYYRINVSEAGTYVIWTNDALAGIQLPEGGTLYEGASGFAFVYHFIGTSAIFRFSTSSGAAASYTVYAARVLTPFSGVGDGTAEDPHEIGIGEYFADNDNRVYLSPAGDGTHYVLNARFTGTYTFTLTNAPSDLVVKVNGVNAEISGGKFTVEAQAGERVSIVFSAGAAGIFDVAVTLASDSIVDPMADGKAGTQGDAHVLESYNSFTIPADKSGSGVWFVYRAASDGVYEFKLITVLTNGKIAASSTARVIYGDKTFSSGNPLTFEATLTAGTEALIRIEWSQPSAASAINVDLLSVVRTGGIPELTGNVIALGEETPIPTAGDEEEWYFKAPADGWYAVRSVGTESVFINEIRWGGPSYYGTGNYMFYASANEITTFYVSNSGAASIRVDSLDELKKTARELTEVANKNGDWTTFTIGKNEWHNGGVLIKFTVKYEATDAATILAGQSLKVDGKTVGGLYLTASALIGRGVETGTTQYSEQIVTPTLSLGQEVYVLVGVSQNVTVTSSVSFQLRVYPYTD